MIHQNISSKLTYHFIFVEYIHRIFKIIRNILFCQFYS